MTVGEVKRAVRVAERVREEAARAIAELQNPRLAGVLVTRVEMTDDLQIATVFVRLGAGGDERPARTAVLRALESASGRLRREVAQAVRLRYAPALRFRYDEGLDATRRIEEVLAEIHREDAARKSG